MSKPIFYDPQRKRWKRLRIVFDILALGGLILGTIFFVGLIRMRPLPELLLASQKRNYRTLSQQKNQKLRRSAHRSLVGECAVCACRRGRSRRRCRLRERQPAR